MKSTDLLNKGIELQRKGNYAAASKVYRDVLDYDPLNADAFNLLGLVAYQTGDYETAVEFGTKCTNINGKFAPARVNVGNAYYAMGKYALASTHYQNALDLDDHLADAHYGLALVAIATKHFVRARRALQRCVELAPSHAAAHTSSGQLSMHDNDWPEARDHFDAALKASPSSTPALKGRATSRRALGDNHSAIRDWQKLIDIDPNDTESFIDLGIAHMNIGQLDKAEQYLTQALETNSDSLEAQVNLANTLRAQGKPVNAIEVLEKTSKQHPEDANAWCFLGAALMEAGQFDEARRALNNARRRNAYDRRALAYASTLSIKTHSETESERLLKYNVLLKIKRPTKPREFPSLNAFNQALLTHVLSHPSLSYERAGNTTKGGFHTGNLLLGTVGPCKHLEAIINREAKIYFDDLPKNQEHPYLAWQPSKWRLNMWGVALESGGYQDAHIHPEAWLSGVYYLQVPDNMKCAGEKAGFLEIGRGPEAIGVENENWIRAIEPEPGRMILFPSYYYHRTLPFDSHEKRVCIAFDLVPILSQ